MGTTSNLFIMSKIKGKIREKFLSKIFGLHLMHFTPCKVLYSGEKRTRIKARSPVVTVTDGLETPIQIFYTGLLFLILITFIGSFANQVIARRELDEAAKIVADRINSKNISASDYFEMGAILTKKKLYVQALRYLQKCIILWDGEEVEL